MLQIYRCIKKVYDHNNETEPYYNFNQSYYNTNDCRY